MIIQDFIFYFSSTKEGNHGLSINATNECNLFSENNIFANFHSVVFTLNMLLSLCSACVAMGVSGTPMYVHDL